MHLVLLQEDHAGGHEDHATRRPCWRQSNAFDKSVSSAQNDVLFSMADFHFLSIAARQC